MKSEKYFDEVANQWDQMRKRFFSDRVREVALASVDIQAGKLAADIGAGTGFITEGLAQNGLKVIAVDQSKAMLEEMEKKLNRYDTVKYRIGNFDNLPITNETVDYIFANMYLHHVDLPQLAIQEMVRVLKTGGKVVVTDLDKHDFEFLRKEQHDHWLGFRREDIESWLREAGLKDIKVESVMEDCCSCSDGSDEKASIGIFVASGEK